MRSTTITRSRATDTAACGTGRGVQCLLCDDPVPAHDDGPTIIIIIVIIQIRGEHCAAASLRVYAAPSARVVTARRVHTWRATTTISSWIFHEKQCLSLPSPATHRLDKSFFRFSKNDRRSNAATEDVVRCRRARARCLRRRRLTPWTLRIPSSGYVVITWSVMLVGPAWKRKKNKSTTVRSTRVPVALNPHYIIIYNPAMLCCT